MHEQVKEAFNQLKALVNRVAAETGSDVVMSRIRRKQAFTFEIVPNGSPYGPRIRVSERQLMNPVYVQNLIETQAVKLRGDIDQLKEDMLSWEDE